MIGLRHDSTAFACTDAMWTTYGRAIGQAAGGFDDPKTKTAPTVNVYLVPAGIVAINRAQERGYAFATASWTRGRIDPGLTPATAAAIDCRWRG